MPLAGESISEVLGAMPPLSSATLEFDVADELRLMVVDLFRRNKPSTILGVIYEHYQEDESGISPQGIAKTLEKPLGIVAWNVEKLEEADLCVAIRKRNAFKVIPFAAYTVANGEDLALGYQQVKKDGSLIDPSAHERRVYSTAQG